MGVKTSLKQYDPDMVCPKCGSSDIVNSYHEAHYPYKVPGANYYSTVDYDEETIGQYCRNCNYSWQVACIGNEPQYPRKQNINPTEED